MILAAAQVNSIEGNIFDNLSEHIHWIKKAAESKVDLIVFPEMSLTGYTREKAESLAFSREDPRLDELRELAVVFKMIIVVGAPIKIQRDLYIGSFILKPDGSLSIYTKQFLHQGEEQFFESSFDYNPILEIGRERVSFAICADIDNPLHPEKAHQNRSTIYVCSIFFSGKGISKGHEVLGNYAKSFSLNVLMSNYSGDCWGLTAGGKSAFWTNDGELCTAMEENSRGLVVVESQEGSWKKQNVRIGEKDRLNTR
ncbi:carbon-nitrogen hydrolase family protein [Xanthovirga aplysinae]|uniref:carbon-nitrogen hydrolase family protein n=1 Tax=Xanthovirga aplysinae TaxID=2529853 RepID=UPI0012BD7F20|nr:carbon-nitrogen hydrolase family protein [Xanthovirga aplysinae]MTI31071.1 carbon-nitrogen hydrolase family protein [Xanthovirga aplysinae]